jgi:hypothetical protein
MTTADTETVETIEERLASVETGLRAVVLLIEADGTASPLLHRCAGVLKMSVPWSGEE